MVINSKNEKKRDLFRATTGDDRLENPGPYQYVGFYVLLSKEQRNRLQLTRMTTRDTKVFSKIFNPVYIRKVDEDYEIDNWSNTIKQGIKNRIRKNQ